MRRLISRKSASNRKNKNTGEQESRSLVLRLRKYLPHVLVIGVFGFFIGIGLWNLFSIRHEDAIARSEYEGLREIFASTPEQQEQPVAEPSEDETEATEEPEDNKRLSMDELARINPDLVGWISIEGHVEYPVVRGNNNNKYIYTTFTGQTNNAGAIFMDYRNRNGFEDEIVIIFGHRMGDGTMFTSLPGYLNRDFLRDNQIITITTRDGDELTYRIFSARQTDAWDTAYTISFTDTARAPSTFPGAPANADRFLLLSTCTPSNNRDERIIVYAALEG